ncbi:hypothetical protein P5F41_15675 [Clostridium perfringens]|nr:hypothetical protein [Clostridium perfringens]
MSINDFNNIKYGVKGTFGYKVYSSKEEFDKEKNYDIVLNEENYDSLMSELIELRKMKVEYIKLLDKEKYLKGLSPEEKSLRIEYVDSIKKELVEVKENYNDLLEKYNKVVSNYNKLLKENKNLRKDKNSNWESETKTRIELRKKVNELQDKNNTLSSIIGRWQHKYEKLKLQKTKKKKPDYYNINEINGYYEGADLFIEDRMYTGTYYFIKGKVAGYKFNKTLSVLIPVPQTSTFDEVKGYIDSKVNHNLNDLIDDRHNKLWKADIDFRRGMWRLTFICDDQRK